MTKPANHEERNFARLVESMGMKPLPPHTRVTVLVLLAMLGSTSTWIVRKSRQVNLDRALIAAIKSYDLDGADRLLADFDYKFTRRL